MSMIEMPLTWLDTPIHQARGELRANWPVRALVRAAFSTAAVVPASHGSTGTGWVPTDGGGEGGVKQVPGPRAEGSAVGGMVASRAASTCSNARLRRLLDTTKKSLSSPM